MPLPPATQYGRSRFILRTAQRKQTLLRQVSTATSAGRIPPESPKFIDIPQPPQRFAVPPQTIKGVLPVPRKIFPRGSPNKTSHTYLAAVTPEPTTKKNYDTVSPEMRDFDLWKDRQSAARRKNLREGLVGLHKRKQRMDQKLSARSQFRQAEHIRKVQAPEREDERLASPTVLHFMKQHTQSLPDPNREQRITKKQEKLRAIEEEKKEERRNALHTLYMNARDFIVTEADLNEKVDQVFDDPWFKQNEGYSIWDKEGLPEGVTDMLGRLNKKSMKSAIEYNSGYAQITRERVQRIAEELTGGKM